MSQVPAEVLEYLRYEAKKGETYQGFTLIRKEYVDPPCGVGCCGYESIILVIRTPTVEEVEAVCSFQGD